MHKNLTEGERLASVALGLLLVPKSKGSKLSMLLRGAIGLGLLQRGATGHCALYERFDIDRNRKTFKPSGPKSVLVNKTLEEMQKFVSEKLRGDESGRFRLTVDGQDWDFSIRPNPYDTRTILDIRRANFQQPTRIMEVAEKLKLVDPEMSPQLILQKLKAYIECGEIPSIKGQPHGQRSMIGERLSQDSIERPMETVSGQIRQPSPRRELRA